MSGGKVQAIFYEPLTAANVLLTKNQKALGSALVDIGYGKTSVCVYDNNQLVHVKTLPLGGSDITNDLAIGLRVPINIAENIKVSLGHAMAKSAPSRELVNLKDFDASLKGSVSRRFIAEIIEERLAEILELINNNNCKSARKLLEENKNEMSDEQLKIATLRLQACSQ